MKSMVMLFLQPLFFLSCATITAVKHMQAGKASVIEWDNSNKHVLFIPMVHVGKTDFYLDVKAIIENKKENGFIVYYEGTGITSCNDSIANLIKQKDYFTHFYKGSYNNDSICLDTYRRKMRRMVGISIDSTGYAKYFHQKGFLKKLIDQPKASSLGIDNADYRVDIFQNELIDEYERIYGEINLRQIDYSIPINGINRYPRSLKLPKEKVRSILIDHRNRHLARYIHTSPHKNIIVIYGAAHEKGVLTELKRLDYLWEKK